MGDWSDHRNLGRQGEATLTAGMWPDGESALFRNTYDYMLRRGLTDLSRRADDGTTKVCYACRGSCKKSDGTQCTACSGTGSVPAAS